MQSVSSYIKNNQGIKRLDFATVYTTIIELLKDGRAVMDDNVQICQQQPDGK